MQTEKHIILCSSTVSLHHDVEIFTVKQSLIHHKTDGDITTTLDDVEV